MEYYVYARRDTGQVFYVGKGKEKRAFTHSSRNRYWKHIVEKASGFDVQFLHYAEDEELTFLIEMEAIDLYKRLGKKLCNMTDGGEGTSGMVLSEKTKQNMREKALGRPSGFRGHKHTEENKQHLRELRLGKTGYKHTEEHKRYMSESQKGKKRPESVAYNISKALSDKPRSTQWINDGLNNKMIRSWEDIP